MTDFHEKYDITVGIECHVQLATKTKLFSPADNDARDKAPNQATHEIDFALPGMLPRLNRQAVVLAARAGKALNAPIANVSRFDRKHYFYPDLPKGYQTSQLYQPIIQAGYVYLESAGKPGTLGKQICEGGDFSGEALSATVESLEKVAKAWHRKHLRIIDDYDLPYGN
jgi:Asp-tRNA(Asn)/Glu-tRNA(Gln) amidotransferase B subunit